MTQEKKEGHAVGRETNPREVFSAYDQGLCSAGEAAGMLGVSRATFHRQLKAWRENGTVPHHGNVGRAPSNKVPEDVRQHVVGLIETRYHDFQPTLLQKYLAGHHGIELSVEWLRRLLKELHPEVTSTARRQAAHRLRRRRSSRGQLVQIDGSPHRWFGEDGDMCCLIIFIDDATSAIEAAGFFPTETTHAYVTVLRALLAQRGLPVSLYSDRYSVFTTNVDMARQRELSEPTQFQRICEMLGIELILARSPQAKGRVERAFRTLQGRWPKEFRVRGIKTMAEANERIPELLEEYNREFAIAPADAQDSYVLLDEDEKSGNEFIFGTWHSRTISRNLTVSKGKETLQIVGVGSAMRVALPKTEVQVVEFDDGRLELYWCDEVRWEDACRREGRRLRRTYQKLSYKSHKRWDKKPDLAKDAQETLLETSKTVDARVDEAVGKRESPWRSSMTEWAQEGQRRREEKQRKLEEAKAVEARVAAARAAAKKNG